MSDLATPLNGRRAVGYVTVSEDAPRGMISLRGDLSDGGIAEAVRAVTGANLPEPLGLTAGEAGQVAWMSPDELLLFVAPNQTTDALTGLRSRLEGVHHLALDVTDMRAAFRLEGRGVREVLAKVTPVDMQTLAPDTVRRTRLAQVAGAVWLSDEETAHVVCFSSVGTYVFDVLATSAAPGGEVGVF
ncbi:sarcosine oxidase subunit gamma [Palleronia caenipelagi]|nr:sarcosine oxidase subunit gamma family protein [Palleronia caenipelagi]